MRIILKKARKTNKKIAERAGEVKEGAYSAWMENRHLLDIVLFILAVIVLLRASMYFLIELAL